MLNSAVGGKSIRLTGEYLSATVRCAELFQCLKSPTTRPAVTLNIHLSIQRIGLDELAPGLHQLTYQAAEHVVGFVGAGSATRSAGFT